MIKFFRKNLPRWVLLWFDVLLSLLSLSLAYLLRFNFDIPPAEYDFFPLAFIAVFSVRFAFFYLFKTHKSIIRYTSTDDGFNIFFSIISGSFFLALANLVRYYLIDQKFILPFSVLIIEFLSTLFFIMAYRIAIKVFYLELRNPVRNRSGVIIYGAGEAGLIAKRAVEQDRLSKLKVIAFIDDHPKLNGKNLEGVRIYKPSKLDQIIEKYHPSHLIISSKKILSENKKQIIEKCLQKDINVLNVPPVKKWINGELSFRQIKQVNIEDLLGREPIVIETEKVAKQVNNKVILITGAAGSIGSELVRQLFTFNPKKLILLDVAESPLYELDNELKLHINKLPYEIVIGDVRNKARMKRVFQYFQPQLVFHAAAYKHVPLMENNPAESALTNVIGTKVTADLAQEYKVEKFILVSTDKAVNPTNVMGATKRMAELYVQTLNQSGKTKYIITRFGNVLGSNGSVIPLFKKQIERGGPITVTHPEITRYFMTIPEACQLVLQAAALGKGGEVFVFDMGESVKIIDLAKKMIKLSGLQLGKDIQIVFTGLRPGEKLYEELLADKENTLPTPHQKIMIAKVNTPDEHKIQTAIKQLQESIDKQDNTKLIEVIKDTVEEYKNTSAEFQKSE